MMGKRSMRVGCCGQKGLSLIELMIGMTLGLVVLGAVLYVFAGNRASYRHQESLSMVQETGRFALELLSRDIRMAGYAGCGRGSDLAYLSGGFSNGNVVTGATGATANDPDSVGIWRGAFSTRLASLTSNPSATQLVVDNAGLLNGAPDRIIVTDCVYAEIVELEAIAGNTLTIDAGTPLIRTYGVGAQVLAFEQANYVVDAVDNRLLRNGDVLAEGVTNLKITYGVSTGADRVANSYVATPANWERVVSARINLTVQDGNVTLPFSTTATLRNRVP